MAFWRCAKFHPIRLLQRRPVTLLKKQNIRNNARPGISLERIIGETDRPNQVCTVGDVLAHGCALLIHRAA